MRRPNRKLCFRMILRSKFLDNFIKKWEGDPISPVGLPVNEGYEDIEFWTGQSVSNCHQSLRSVVDRGSRKTINLVEFQKPHKGVRRKQNLWKGTRGGKLRRISDQIMRNIRRNKILPFFRRDNFSWILSFLFVTDSESGEKEDRISQLVFPMKCRFVVNQRWYKNGKNLWFPCKIKRTR
jgi:hypothetical protein